MSPLPSGRDTRKTVCALSSVPPISIDCKIYGRNRDSWLLSSCQASCGPFENKHWNARRRKMSVAILTELIPLRVPSTESQRKNKQAAPAECFASIPDSSKETPAFLRLPGLENIQQQLLIRPDMQSSSHQVCPNIFALLHHVRKVPLLALEQFIVRVPRGDVQLVLGLRLRWLERTGQEAQLGVFHRLGHLQKSNTEQTG